MFQTDGVNLPHGSINLNVGSGGTAKTSSNLNFSAQLRKVMSQGASAASHAASVAAPMVPGASVMSAVLSKAASKLGENEISSPTSNVFGLGSEKGGMVQNFEQMQQKMMSMNMHMIGVQRQFQQMSEQYTLASNALKTTHDAKKNAIGNIR